jgi:hypothetical protein
MAIESKDVALKFLDLARGEILEKVRFVNQTLGAYLLGTSAVASWFYQSVYKTQTPISTGPNDHDRAMAAVGLALMLSYLALGVNWIIHHNERMVTALALYQRRELYGVVGDVPPMWERSDSLTSEDSLPHALLTVIVEELIVLAPPLAALVFALSQDCAATWWPTHIWLPLCVVANLASTFIGVLMIVARTKLRRGDL